VKAALAIETHQVVHGTHAERAVEGIGLAVQRASQLLGGSRPRSELVGDAELDQGGKEVPDGEPGRMLEDRQFGRQNPVRSPEQEASQLHRGMDGEAWRYLCPRAAPRLR
jgi:hypothetical protein